MSEVIEIPASLAGERVDRVLALLLGRTRSDVAELIADKAVVLSGKVVEHRSQRVAAGEILDIGEIAPRLAKVLRPASSIAFDVVFADRSIIVVDKPAGLVVHPGAGHVEDTLVSGLIERYPDLVSASAAGAGEAMRPGIVHRLDKDTSGLMVVARTPEAYAHLVGQLASHAMGRTYATLVLGHVEANEGAIEAPLGRSVRRPTMMAIRAGGREARTHYRALGRFEQPLAATLLEVRLETGRTHQIRVHFSGIGHPVVGDRVYGGRVKDVVLARPFLHAKALRLVHPETNEEVSFTSELPADLEEVLAGLS